MSQDQAWSLNALKAGWRVKGGGKQGGRGVRGVMFGARIERVEFGGERYKFEKVQYFGLK